jgi:hypothetical protein
LPSLPPAKQKLTSLRFGHLSNKFYGTDLSDVHDLKHHDKLLRFVRLSNNPYGISSKASHLWKVCNILVILGDHLNKFFETPFILHASNPYYILVKLLAP